MFGAAEPKPLIRICSQALLNKVVAGIMTIKEKILLRQGLKIGSNLCRVDNFFGFFFVWLCCVLFVVLLPLRGRIIATRRSRAGWGTKIFIWIPKNNKKGPPTDTG